MNRRGYFYFEPLKNIERLEITRAHPPRLEVGETAWEKTNVVVKVSFLL